MGLHSAFWLSFCLGSIIPAIKNTHPDFLDIHLHTPKLYFFSGLVILWDLKIFSLGKKKKETQTKTETTQAQQILLSVRK